MLILSAQTSIAVPVAGFGEPVAVVATAQADPLPLEVEVTAQNVDQVVDSSKVRPVVMIFASCDCGGAGCPLCNPAKRVLQDLVKKDNGLWSLATVNSKSQPELVAKFGVTDKVALVVVKNSEVKAKEAAPKADAIAAWVHQKIA